MKIVKKILSVISFILGFALTFITFLAFFATKWLRATYGNISFDEILYTLSSPIRGTEGTLIDSFKVIALRPAIIVSVIFFAILSTIYAFLLKSNFKISFKLFRSKEHHFKISGLIPFFLLLIVSLGYLASILNTCIDEVGIKEYYFNQTQNSTFVAENYVDPNDVNLIFPEQKRNLIHIYVESFESSYFSKDLGGLEDNNLLEDLTKLTSDGVNFSESDKIGGAYATYGSTFTSAGLTSQMLGIPVLICEACSIGMYEQHEHFLQGAVGIGNILEENGYRQYFIMGSEKEFGNRDKLLKEHGNYQVYDLNSAHEDGSLPEDYHVYWGFEDSKLFSFAKKQLTEIAKEDKPFNYSLLTVNNHPVDGYLEQDCKQKYPDQYTNVLSCTASQIADFVSWAKKQDFYKNTTIVITGDHLTMKAGYFDDDVLNERRVYNLFINASVEPINAKNRQFTTLDIFPTTLAAMGVKIEGNRLGLGTNLFSNEATLAEQYGIELLNSEFEKRSIFYTDRFILGKK